MVLESKGRYLYPPFWVSNFKALSRSVFGGFLGHKFHTRLEDSGIFRYWWQMFCSPIFPWLSKGNSWFGYLFGEILGGNVILLVHLICSFRHHISCDFAGSWWFGDVFDLLSTIYNLQSYELPIKWCRIQGWFQGLPIMGPPYGKLPIPFPYL